MNPRREEILFRTVSEYIKTGEPVSSQWLYRKYDLGIKPASIRAELNELESGGWLSQPYTSGGRMPTNRAFKIFAERAIEEVEEEPLDTDFSFLAKSLLEHELELFVSELSHEVHALGVAFSFIEGRSVRSGLDELFNRLDVDDPSVYKGIARDFEILDERIEEIGREDYKGSNGPRILFGEKGPFIKNEHVSTIFDIFDAGGESLLLFTVSPKRTDYKKNFKIFRGLKEAIRMNNE